MYASSFARSPLLAAWSQARRVLPAGYPVCSFAPTRFRQTRYRNEQCDFRAFGVGLEVGASAGHELQIRRLLDSAGHLLCFLNQLMKLRMRAASKGFAGRWPFLFLDHVESHWLALPLWSVGQDWLVIFTSSVAAFYPWARRHFYRRGSFHLDRFSRYPGVQILFAAGIASRRLDGYIPSKN